MNLCFQARSPLKMNPNFTTFLILILYAAVDAKQKQQDGAVSTEARKIMLCLKALREYVAESDNNYTDERALAPHCK